MENSRRISDRREGEATAVRLRIPAGSGEAVDVSEDSLLASLFVRSKLCDFCSTESYFVCTTTQFLSLTAPAVTATPFVVLFLLFVSGAVR